MIQPYSSDTPVKVLITLCEREFQLKLQYAVGNTGEVAAVMGSVSRRWLATPPSKVAPLPLNVGAAITSTLGEVFLRLNMKIEHYETYA